MTAFHRFGIIGRPARKGRHRRPLPPSARPSSRSSKDRRSGLRESTSAVYAKLVAALLTKRIETSSIARPAAELTDAELEAIIRKEQIAHRPRLAVQTKLP
jgi:hypothetical protein